MVRRRRLLLATVAAGTVGTAGCIADDSDDEDDEDPENNTDSDDDPENGDTQSTDSEDEDEDEETPSDLESTADGVYRVDIDAVSDRAMSIDDSRWLTYDGDPEVVWGYERVLESDRSDESTPELTVDPVVDTTDDVENLFLVPVYDADDETWLIHAYADETYYETRETQRFWIGRFYAESDAESTVDDREASFTEHHDGVYRATVEYGETPPQDEHPDQLRSVILANESWDETALQESDLILGAIVYPARSGATNPDYDEADPSDPAPVVDLSFEYDPDAKTVTIVHEDGPAFQGEHVQVGFEGGLTEAQFSGEITVGDELTVDVPSADPGEYLSVSWRGPEDEHHIVLDRFEIPE